MPTWLPTRNRFTRRALLGLTTASLVASGALTTPASAALAPEARSASTWAVGQLDDGVVHNDQYDFTDVGLSLDMLLALQELGARPAFRELIVEAVEQHADGYVGTGTDSYAAQLGKVLTAVQQAGVRPNQYGAGGYLTRLKERVRPAGKQAGRAVDASQFGNYTRTIGQSYVVQAFALARQPRYLRLTTQFLLKQQCPGGWFREGVESSDFTCATGRREGRSAPSVDATAIAVMGLQAARRHGVKGLGDDIRDALRWLANRQATNGSFTGNGVANANSTGLATWVLADSAYERAALRGARWLRTLQVSSADAQGSPLAGEVGAVAYDAAALRAGSSDGITTESRDQWRRATAQAMVGLDALRTAR